MIYRTELPPKALPHRLILPGTGIASWHPKLIQSIMSCPFAAPKTHCESQRSYNPTQVVIFDVLMSIDAESLSFDAVACFYSDFCVG